MKKRSFRWAKEEEEEVVLLPNFNLIMAKHLLTKAVGVTLPRPTSSLFSV